MTSHFDASELVSALRRDPCRFSKLDDGFTKTAWRSNWGQPSKRAIPATKDTEGPGKKRSRLRGSVARTEKIVWTKMKTAAAAASCSASATRSRRNSTPSERKMPAANRKFQYKILGAFLDAGGAGAAARLIDDLVGDLAIGLAIELVVAAAAGGGDARQLGAIENRSHHRLVRLALRIGNDAARRRADADHVERDAAALRQRERLGHLAAPRLAVGDQDERLGVLGCRHLPWDGPAARRSSSSFSISRRPQ